MVASSRKCPTCKRAFLTVERTVKAKTLRCPVCGWVQHKLKMGAKGG